MSRGRLAGRLSAAVQASTQLVGRWYHGPGASNADASATRNAAPASALEAGDATKHRMFATAEAFEAQVSSC